MSEGSDRVIDVYSTNPAYSVLARQRLFKQSFFKIYRMNQSILKKMFKKRTQQLNHESDLCKKDLQGHLEKKEKVDLVLKSLYPCLRKMRG